MTEQPNRNRPAYNPGGMECEKCGAIFIGADWHYYCGVCVEEVAAEEAAKRQRSNAEIVGGRK